MIGKLTTLTAYNYKPKGIGISWLIMKSVGSHGLQHVHFLLLITRVHIIKFILDYFVITKSNSRCHVFFLFDIALKLTAMYNFRGREDQGIEKISHIQWPRIRIQFGPRMSSHSKYFFHFLTFCGQFCQNSQPICPSKDHCQIQKTNNV